MRFRTEIENIHGSFEISHRDKIVLIGSCFADNIGTLLEKSGFDVTHNPLGPLFNPQSVGHVLGRGGEKYKEKDFILHSGTWHCLYYANRYQSTDAATLAQMVNKDYVALAESLAAADVLVITLGTSKVYRLNGTTAGNCHKLPGTIFSEDYLDVDAAVESIVSSIDKIAKSKRVIITLSPVRYPGEGLSKGFLAKATLRVAIDKICCLTGADYFPAFEIVNDDLRDYRFYAPDMRHPSDQAIEYIYEKFGETYFSENTIKEAEKYRKLALHGAHRPIITDKK